MWYLVVVVIINLLVFSFLEKLKIIFGEFKW